MHGSLRILATGPFACVQDLGRSGYACIGVGESGAADRGALRLANRLVGNPEDAAGIEVLMGGFAARAHEPTLIAITGAAGQATVNGRPVGMNAAVAVSAGAVLQLEAAQTGLRRYLSLRGGIDVAPVLGSRATDTFSGVGPAPLAPGTLLPIGVPHLPVPDIDVAAVAPPDADPVLTITAGPRADWFRSDALVGRFYTVSPDSDRVAVRLRGKRVRRTVERDLAPEGLVRGAVQVPSDGQPLIFLADHPVTGGYPVVAVLTDTAIDRAAQLRPGQTARFAR
jgi:biotin-dependent carboxylase-like uncharacterized protein